MSFFFFNDTATTEIYPLSLPDPLPISDGNALRCTRGSRRLACGAPACQPLLGPGDGPVVAFQRRRPPPRQPARVDRKSTRLNSSHAKISYAVFCLKKKKKKNISNTIL